MDQSDIECLDAHIDVDRCAHRDARANGNGHVDLDRSVSRHRRRLGGDRRPEERRGGDQYRNAASHSLPGHGQSHVVAGYIEAGKMTIVLAPSTGSGMCCTSDTPGFLASVELIASVTSILSEVASARTR